MTQPPESGPDHEKQLIERIADAQTEDFRELLKIADLDPATDLRFMDWSGVDFSGTDLSGCDFTGANLIGCKFENALLWMGGLSRLLPARFDRAQLDRNALRMAKDWEGFAQPSNWSLAEPRSVDHLPDFAVFSDAPFAPEMVILPAGEFWLGATGEEQQADDLADFVEFECPRHLVRITEPFALAKYPVTFEEYDAFCAATGREKPEDQGWGRGRRPVITVSWEDARAYCDWLSEQTGEAYRLPSEAEWEYACRAETSTRYWWGDDWDASRANGPEGEQTNEVDRYDANPWGLHDMHGNVDEWCEDLWEGDYEQPRTQQAFIANGGTDRVIRGGSWLNDARDCRSAFRLRFAPDLRFVHLGFRPARGQASGAQAGGGGAAGDFGPARGAVSGANGKRPGRGESPPSLRDGESNF